MLTCTWAPTTFQGTRVVAGARSGGPIPSGADLEAITTGHVAGIEALGLSHLLIAQRWWGTGAEIEASSLDCLAMTAYFAARTERINLITAIHPGFFQPAAIAKWGATLDRLTRGRWAINLTSGWNLEEFRMYGVDPLDHDARYARTAEFAHILRAAWDNAECSFAGRHYRVDGLRLEPRPEHPLTVYQGGQSDAAMRLAAEHSDWMFFNGGPPEKIAALIERARAAFNARGRQGRFAVYAAPLCRATDAAAWEEVQAMVARVDPELVAARRARVGGAQGMWENDDDALSCLDTNEGYASRLIGSPATILQRVRELKALGVDMLHLDLRDRPFVEEVLPEIHGI